MPLAVAAVITRTRSYRMFVLLLTPVFVLVTNRWHPGYYTAAIRIADVALGGALAGIAALIAPSTERQRLPDVLVALIDAIQRYVELTFAIVPTTADRAPLANARRAVGIAFENAEVSLERMLAEPKLLQHGAERAMLLITYARRLSGALTSHSIADHAPLSPPVKTYVMTALTAARDAAPPPPQDPPDESRLVHYAELIRAQARLV
jgi:hypothetical protein